MRFLLTMVFFLYFVNSRAEVCGVTEFTDDQIREKVSNARASNIGIAKAYEKFEWSVHKDGCYYIYIEHESPPTPGKSQVFRLNQYGVLVDAFRGR